MEQFTEQSLCIENIVSSPAVEDTSGITYVPTLEYIEPTNIQVGNASNMQESVIYDMDTGLPVTLICSTDVVYTAVDAVSIPISVFIPYVSSCVMSTGVNISDTVIIDGQTEQTVTVDDPPALINVADNLIDTNIFDTARAIITEEQTEQPIIVTNSPVLIEDSLALIRDELNLSSDELVLSNDSSELDGIVTDFMNSDSSFSQLLRDLDVTLSDFEDSNFNF